MSKKQHNKLDSRIASALDELTTIIRVRYPEAQFEVMRGIDDPRAIHLTAVADIRETDDIVDLVIDRLLELQVEEQLPIHVIPIRAKERISAIVPSPVSYAHARSSNSPEQAL